jgi:hypothetical protein
MRARGPAFAGLAFAIAVLGHAACGGDSSPASPTPSPAPAPTPTPAPSPTPAPVPTERWAISGQVVTLGSSRPVAAARITSEVGVTTQSDAAGGFRLGSNTDPEFTPHAFTVEADGFVPRKAYVRWERGLRTGIAFDLIPLTAPFSIEFYRAFVRNAYDAPGQLEPLRRWTSSPRFYVRSVDQNGRAIEPEVMDVVLGTIPDAVRQFTGGRIGVAQIESGVETRPPAAGWIAVNIVRDPSSDACGRSMVGADPGEITLYDDRCGCGSYKIRGRTVAHEVGHALGFWHVPGTRGVMTGSAPGCPGVEFSAEELYHGPIAYQRAVGNLDPDADPQTTSAQQLRGARGDAPVVSCTLR